MTCEKAEYGNQQKTLHYRRISKATPKVKSMNHTGPAILMSLSLNEPLGCLRPIAEG